MARCLCQCHIARHDRIEYDISKKLANFVAHFGSQLQIRLIHRQQNTTELQLTGPIFHDLADDVNHLSQAFHCEVLALDRHQHFC